jgi:predicted metal-dependent hydrolase
VSARPLQSWLDRADELGAAGRFFDAHEELEEGWKAVSGAEKILLQGLIQIAAGLHRLTLKTKNRDGADYLLDRGLMKLRANQALLTLDSLTALETALARVRASAEAPVSLRFGLRAR